MLLMRETSTGWSDEPATRRTQVRVLQLCGILRDVCFKMCESCMFMSMSRRSFRYELARGAAGAGWVHGVLCQMQMRGAGDGTQNGAGA